MTKYLKSFFVTLGCLVTVVGWVWVFMAYTDVVAAIVCASLLFGIAWIMVYDLMYSYKGKEPPPVVRTPEGFKTIWPSPPPPPPPKRTIKGAVNFPDAQGRNK
jgi:hypothetical protein